MIRLNMKNKNTFERLKLTMFFCALTKKSKDALFTVWDSLSEDQIHAIEKLIKNETITEQFIQKVGPVLSQTLKKS